jgi:predicted transcriptional regulator
MSEDQQSGDDAGRAGTRETEASRRETSEGTSLSQSILELDEVYRALGHPRRRYLCYTLHESDEWSLDELAAKIAAWDYDIDVEDVTDRQRDQVYVDLYHAHVPKLVELGVIRFDEDEETIDAAETATQVLRALEGMGATLDSNQEAHARESGGRE